LENGEPTVSLSEMNVTGNIASIFERLVDVANDPWPYSSMRLPTLIFDDVKFSGS
ncbi:MAG: TldD/PmbA family protein, partial [Proteobacteria bacterium]|nr:TldD/PmbA family protein [Pseudomonadota bacterium]